MMASSSESEGEIFETTVDKAFATTRSIDNSSIDRQSRIRASASKSPRNTVEHVSERYKSRSRSPYRHRSPRGEKRRRDDDYNNERDRSDPRRFKVHYEDRSSFQDDRRNRVSYADIDRGDPPPQSTRGGRDSYRDGCLRTRSRSPGHSGRRGDRYDRRDRYDRHDRSRRNDNFGGRDYAGRSNGVDSRRSREQSVSERGDPIPDAHKSWKNAEIRRHDTQQNSAKTHSTNGVTT